MTQGKIRRFCMEKTGPKNAHISAANCSKQLNFGDWGIFHHALSKYVIASHNFTNSIFMTSSLYHSISERKDQETNKVNGYSIPSMSLEKECRTK